MNHQIFLMTNRLMNTFIAAFFTGLLLVTNVWAEQQVKNRYQVQGYVLDENDKGLVNQQVKIFKGRILLEMGKTNAEGFYSLQFKLRDSDNQKLLKLTAGSNQAELRVTFDDKGSNALRVHKANFIDGKFVEGGLNGFRFPTWIYPIVGLIVISLLAVKLEKRRKKKIQQKKDKLSGRQSTSSHHAKKKRRKKH
ncbi:MAG: hypothetical protein GY744_18765 [Gammaproteobacteria bacterium]|nr:hypothetical protein [Gammaproteobacteria bacterium]